MKLGRGRELGRKLIEYKSIRTEARLRGELPPLSDHPNHSPNPYLSTHDAAVALGYDNGTNDPSGGTGERRNAIRRRRVRSTDNAQTQRRTRRRLNTAVVETASVATQTPREDDWDQETDDSDDDEEDDDDIVVFGPTDEWSSSIERRQREDAIIDLTNYIFDLTVFLCVIRLIRIRYD